MHCVSSPRKGAGASGATGEVVDDLTVHRVAGGQGRVVEDGYTAPDGRPVRGVEARSPSRRRYRVGAQVHVRITPGRRRDVELHPLAHAIGEAVFLPVVVAGGPACGVMGVAGIVLLVAGLL